MENLKLYAAKAESEIRDLLLKIEAQPVVLGKDMIKIQVQKLRYESSCIALTNAFVEYAKLFPGKQNEFFEVLDSEDPKNLLEDFYLTIVKGKAGISKLISELLSFGVDVLSVAKFEPPVRQAIDYIANQLAIVRLEVDEARECFLAKENRFEIPPNKITEISEQFTVIGSDQTRSELIDAVFLKILLDRWIQHYDYSPAFAFPEISSNAASAIKIIDRSPIDEVHINFDHFTKLNIDFVPDIAVVGVDDKGCPILEVDGQRFRFRYRRMNNLFGCAAEIDFAEIANDLEKLFEVVCMDRSKKLGILDPVE